MPGVVKFKIDLLIENPDLFPELAGRAKDLRPAFDVIVKKWAKDNVDKFEKAIGGESFGSSVDPSVFWSALTPAYIKRKRMMGFADHLMVRTGALEASLEDPGRFFHEESAQEAAFGTPMSEEEEIKARYNFQRRQTIFLSVDDQRMIDATIKNYMEFGEDFQRILFARGMGNLGKGAESAGMDMEFNTDSGGS